MKQRIPTFDAYQLMEKAEKNPGKETVLECITERLERRHKKLKDIKAPKIIIDNLEDYIKDIKSGTTKIKGADEFGDLEYDTVEGKTGRGGKSFVQFVLKDSRIINYFPYAKYGPFIAPHNK